jgi:hypothetical protein
MAVIILPKTVKQLQKKVSLITVWLDSLTINTIC